MATPDWLEGYAKQQGWGDAPQQPDPKDIAELQAYADTFGPKQPKPEDIADLQGTAATLEQPSPIVDPDLSQKPPPAGYENSGGHWERDDDGSVNFYTPPEDDPSIAQTFTEKNKTDKGGKKPNVELAFKIPGTDVDTDALKQGARALWGATLPTSVSNPGPAVEGLSAAKKAGLVQGLASGDPGKTLDAINAGANASAQTPNQFGTKNDSYPEYGPKNPADIDPATGQPRKTAQEEPEPTAPQGHWVNGQWVRTVSPTALGMEGKLELQRGEHAANEADAARAMSLERERIYNQRTAEIQAQVDAARAEQMRTAAARDKADKDYDHAQQVASEAKIDTSKIFSDGGKAAAILGVALGAVGSAILKTPNEAADLVKSHIEHELSAQKTNAANARDTANNAWARLRAATGSAQQADNLYRIAALQTYQAKLDEMNAGPQQRAAIDSALEQAKDTQQARALQFRLQTEKYSPGYMVGGVAPAGGAEADPEKVVQMGHESVGGYAPNTRLVFGKKDDAAAVTDQMQAYGIVQKARDRIAQLEKANPVDIYRPGSEAYEDAKQIRLQAVTQVGHLNGVKKLPIFDAENMNDALDTHMYNAVTGASATHRMDTYLRNAKDALDESVQTRAPEVVRRHLDVNQRGEVTPGNHYTGENIQRAAPPPGFHVRDKGVGTQERAPLQYKPEIRHVTETPGKGKKKKSETVTGVEPEEDEEP